MYLNSITFSKPFKNDRVDNKIKTFNKISTYVVELMFYHLPKRTNIGGYDYFHNNLFVANESKTEIRENGQRINYSHGVDISFDNFLRLSKRDQLDYLLNKIEIAVLEISKHHEVDAETFFKAVENSLGCLKFEQKLKISRSHKSRKVKVDIVRIVEPSSQKIVCRLKTSSDKLIKELLLENEVDLFSIPHDFRKSVWNENVLEIRGRFEQINHSLKLTDSLNDIIPNKR